MTSTRMHCIILPMLQLLLHRRIVAFMNIHCSLWSWAVLTWCKVGVAVQFYFLFEMRFHERPFHQLRKQRIWKQRTRPPAETTTKANIRFSLWPKTFGFYQCFSSFIFFVCVGYHSQITCTPLHCFLWAAFSLEQAPEAIRPIDHGFQRHVRPPRSQPDLPIQTRTPPPRLPPRYWRRGLWLLCASLGKRG